MRIIGAHIMALCAPDTRQFQDLMFDLLRLSLPSVYSFLLSPDSFHLEIETHPVPLYFECGTSMSCRSSRLVCLESQERIQSWAFQEY